MHKEYNVQVLSNYKESGVGEVGNPVVMAQVYPGYHHGCQAGPLSPGRKTIPHQPTYSQCSEERE